MGSGSGGERKGQGERGRVRLGRRGKREKGREGKGRGQGRSVPANKNLRLHPGYVLRLWIKIMLLSID